MRTNKTETLKAPRVTRTTAAVVRVAQHRNTVVVQRDRDLARFKIEQSDDAIRRLKGALEAEMAKREELRSELVGLDAVLAARSMM